MRIKFEAVATIRYRVMTFLRPILLYIATIDVYDLSTLKGCWGNFSHVLILSTKIENPATVQSWVMMISINLAVCGGLQPLLSIVYETAINSVGLNISYPKSVCNIACALVVLATWHVQPITAWAVATSCFISDVSSQWEGAIFDPP